MTIPSTIGRFRITERIGSGPFATVLSARDESLDTKVAIKLLSTEWTFDPETRRRFVREARLLRRVNSRHLITVHDHGRLADGRPFFAMAFADGGTLADRLEAEGGGPQWASTGKKLVRLIDTLAGGLAALHAEGAVHRDINPRSLLFVGRRLVVADLGLARELRLPSDDVAVACGTARYRAPEQGEPGAPAGPAADVYGATAVVWEVVTGTPPPAHYEIDRRLTDITPAWRALFEQGLAADPEARFVDMAAWRAAALTAVDSGADVMVAVVPDPDRCPYPGLVGHESGDADVFHGREALVDRLVERLRREQSLLVGGPSGAGKSSLVRAGLIPALLDGALPGSGTWRTVVMTPGADPLGRLEAALGRKRRPRPRPVVVVVDQLEELFTLGADTETQHRFVERLAGLVERRDGSRVVAVLRSDFYTSCTPFEWLVTKLGRHEYVGSLSRSELRRAVELPALRLGYTVDPELLDTVIEEAASDPGALLHVSQALAGAWEERESSTLSLAAYRRAGSAAGALEQRAERWWGAVDPAEQTMTRGIILRLVLPASGPYPDCCRPLPLTDFDGKGRLVIDSLAEAGLVALGEGVARLAHEAVLTTWSRLAAWIDEERWLLRQQTELLRDAEAWEIAGRSADGLLRGDALASVEEWFDRRRSRLSELERTFVHESRQRARRARVIRSGLIGVVTVLAVVASVTAVLARRAANDAEAAGRELMSRRLAAESVIALDRDDRRLGALLALAGLEVAPTVEARSAVLANLSTSSEDVGVFPVHDGDAVAVDASSDGTYLVSGGLDGIVQVTPLDGGEPLVMRGHEGEVRGVATLDDATAVSVGADGTVRLWDTAEGLELNVWRVGASGRSGSVADAVSLKAVAPSPDGTTVIVGGEGGVWRIDPSDDAVQQLFESDVEVRAVAWRPGHDELAVALDDGRVQVWSESGEFLAEIDAHEDAALALVWMPDGDSIVSVGRDRRLVSWGADSGLRRVEGIHDGVVFGVDVSADGRTIATAAADGRVRLWDVSSGDLQGEFTGHLGDVHDVAFLPQSDSLVSAGADGTLRVWGGGFGTETVRSYEGASGGVETLAWSGEARLIAGAGRDGRLHLWDADTGELVERRRLHDGVITGLGFLGSEAVVTVGEDGQVLISGGDEKIELDLSGEVGRSLAVSRNLGLLAVGLDSGPIALWSLDTAVPEAIDGLAGHDSNVRSLAFHPRRRLLVSTGGDGKLLAWDLGTGEVVTVDQFETGVQSVRFDESGSELAVARADGVISLYDTSNGDLERWNPRHELVGHDGPVRDLAYLPDGVLVSVGLDRSVRLWADGEELARAIPHASAGRAVVVTDDRIVSSDDDGLVVGYPRPEQWMAAVCALARGDLNADEWSRHAAPDAEAIPLCPAGS